MTGNGGGIGGWWDGVDYWWDWWVGWVLARHLVCEGGVRRLLLVSRSGLRAEGARELMVETEGLGCEWVEIVACDVADRSQLEEVITGIPAACPLTMVVHAAGVLDDGVLEALDGERLERVMEPKVDGAINLHELTEGLALKEFILFSSAAATLGSPR